MSAASTVPTDLFIPEACKEYFGYEFYTSLGVLNNLVGTDGNKPINVVNLGLLQNGGQFIQAPIFQPITNLVTRTDETSFAAVDTSKITGRNDRGVRLAFKMGPTAYSQNAEWVSKAKPGQLSMEFGRQAARMTKEYIQNAIVYATKAVIAGMTGSAHTLSVWNATSRTNLSTALLAQGRAKMGDRTGVINSWLMRSESEYDLLAFQLGSGVAGIADKATDTGSVATLGAVREVLDHPTLTVTDAGFDKYYTIGMGGGFCELEFIQGPVFQPVQWLNNADMVQFILRGDMAFSLRFPGIQWDVTDGGANPDPATTLATAGNWTPVYADAREVKAVMIEHNISSN